jgi:hypothetical protein
VERDLQVLATWRACHGLAVELERLVKVAIRFILQLAPISHKASAYGLVC